MATAEDFKNSFEDVYTTPGHPLMHAGINTIYRYYNKTVPRSEIEKALSKIYSYTIYKETKEGRRNHYAIFSKRQQIQLDLADVRTLSEHNNGMQYLFCAIDVFTKLAWCKPLKDKVTSTIMIALKECLDFFNRPRTFFCDKGSEFISRTFQEYCRKKKIKILYAENQTKACIVERWIRTFKRIMFTFLKQKNTFHYLDHINLLLKTYNSRYHRSIGMSPIKAEQSSSQKILRDAARYKLLAQKKKTRKPRYTVGDKVRLKRLKNLFTRSYHDQFTEEIFVVHGVSKKRPIVTYIIKDLADEVISGEFYGFELSQVYALPDYYPIEKVIRRRKTKSGTTEYLVQYRGYPAKFNSWVTDISDI